MPVNCPNNRPFMEICDSAFVEKLALDATVSYVS